MKASVQSPTVLSSSRAMPAANRLPTRDSLTRKEVCAELGIDPSTLYRWERLGLTFIGRRITEADLAFFLECMECARRLKIPAAEFVSLPRQEKERCLERAHMMRCREG